MIVSYKMHINLIHYHEEKIKKILCMYLTWLPYNNKVFKAYMILNSDLNLWEHNSFLIHGGQKNSYNSVQLSGQLGPQLLYLGKK